MIAFFARYPTAANLLMMIFIISGIMALPSLSRETFPDYSTSGAEIQVRYPGASPETVEKGLCLRIEDALDGVTDVAESRCEAREGVAIAVVEMRDGASIERFIRKVATEIDAIDDFPEDAEQPVVREINLIDPVVAVAITGPMTEHDLRAYAEEVKSRMLRTGAITQVKVSGFSQQILRVALDQDALRQYDLSARDVADVIARRNVDLPAGNLTTGDREILVRLDDERRSPEALESLIIRANTTGGTVTLGQVARVTHDFEDAEEKILFNGKRAALLEISKTKEQDALKVRDAVEAFVTKERQTAPPSVQYTTTRDISSIVRDRLTMLTKNGVQGLVLVFLVMWLFFSFRLSFWAVMGLPVSFLGSVFAMVMIGYSINLLTLVALLIAIGVVMDDTIVIAENIAAHRERGKNAITAAIDGTREVMAGVVSSFLTSACVFIPLAFLDGDIGKVLKVVPVVLLITLTVSLMEAFWILPRHMLHVPDSEGPAQGFRARFEQRFAFVRESILGKWVDQAVKWRYLSAGIVLLIFLVSMAMPAGNTLGFRAFPDLDGDVIEARILMPPGTPLGRTEQAVAQLTAALDRVKAGYAAENSGKESLVRQVMVQFNRNQDAYDSGPHLATITVDLLASDERDLKIDAIINRWRDETGAVPDALAITFKEPMIGPAGTPIEIRLHGEELDDLKSASSSLMAWLDRYRGVADLHDDLRSGKPEVQVKLHGGAAQLGLDARTVAGQLRTALKGDTASEVFIGKQDTEVLVGLSGAGRDGMIDLRTYPISLANGRQVPLGTIGSLELKRSVSRIGRINGRRTVVVRGDVDPAIGNVGQIIADTMNRFMPKLQRAHPDIDVSLQGEVVEQKTTQRSIMRGFAFGLLGIFILLSLQFRNYIEPLIVMLAIPFSLIGVIWGHLLLGLDLSMPSILGFASLAGIVVNNSILLVIFVRGHMENGANIADAACRASRDRFRPVMLTSLTTIAGLFPLLFETSTQAQVLIPLVTSLVFGLLASTVMVLLVVPVLYAILHDMRQAHPASGDATENPATA